MIAAWEKLCVPSSKDEITALLSHDSCCEDAGACVAVPMLFLVPRLAVKHISVIDPLSLLFNIVVGLHMIPSSCRSHSLQLSWSMNPKCLAEYLE